MDAKTQPDPAEPAKNAPKRSEPAGTVWMRYAERKFGVQFRRQECHLELRELVATQSEIERIKYELVRHEGYRACEPILVYRGRLGQAYIVDGHTRARVAWDRGERSVPALLITASNVELDGEFLTIAELVGGGTAKSIWEVPITDRLGLGSAAWARRRTELFQDLKDEGKWPAS
jgi:hypothetical protein